MRRLALTLIASMVLITVLPPAFATCTMQVTGPQQVDPGKTFTIEWLSIAGAAVYRVDQSTDPTFLVSRIRSGGISSANTSMALSQRPATYDRTVFYKVTAVTFIQDVETPLCSGTIGILMKGSETLRAESARGIVPVVGTVPGRFGSLFRTSVMMRNQTSFELTGRLVFHPTGRAANENDPSMPYRLAPSEVRSIPDLLAAFGQTGLGSMDIVPDLTRPANVGDFVPEVWTTIYNDSASGRFGTLVPQLRAIDYLDRNVGLVVVAPNPAVERLNLGARALHHGASIRVFARDAEGFVRSAGHNIPPHTLMQMGVDEWMGFPVAAGQEVVMQGLEAIFYYTITDNASNDPRLEVERLGRDTKVGPYPDEALTIIGSDQTP